MKIISFLIKLYYDFIMKNNMFLFLQIIYYKKVNFAKFGLYLED